MEPAVEETVDNTTPTESAPVENKDTDTLQDNPESPADAIIEPEKKVSESVPYERFAEVNNRAKELEERLARLEQTQEVQQPADLPQLDPDVVPALDQWFEQRYEQRREVENAQEFAERNKEKLQDPILAGTVQRLIQNENAKGLRLDPNVALERAEKMLVERMTPKVKEALEKGVEEGKDIAHKKELAGAVGDNQKVKEDISSLTAEEWAKRQNLPRYD